MFYEVYDTESSSEMEAAVGESEANEKFIRFDISTHTADAILRFCELPDLEKKAYNLKCNERPLPYLGAFIPRVGIIAKAFKVAEVDFLVKKARKESKLFGDLE